MSLRFYQYALAGQACMTSMDTLLDNSKYMSKNSPVYGVPYTYMSVYPGGKGDYLGLQKRSENVKPEKGSVVTERMNGSKPQVKSCCGMGRY